MVAGVVFEGNGAAGDLVGLAHVRLVGIVNYPRVLITPGVNVASVFLREERV